LSADGRPTIPLEKEEAALVDSGITTGSERMKKLH
jgi:hypothetical protein